MHYIVPCGVNLFALSQGKDIQKMCFGYYISSNLTGSCTFLPAFLHVTSLQRLFLLCYACKYRIGLQVFTGLDRLQLAACFFLQKTEDTGGGSFFDPGIFKLRYAPPPVHHQNNSTRCIGGGLHVMKILKVVIRA